MSVQTLFVTVGLAYGVLSLLLLVSDRPRRGTPTAMLTAGYALGSVGVLLQAGRGTLPVALSVLAGNIIVWLGLQGQLWAAMRMSGRSCPLRLRLGALAITLALAVPLVGLPPIPRAALANVVYALLFALTAWILLAWRDAPPLLRNVTAGILLLLTAMYGARAVAMAGGLMPANALTADRSALTVAFFTVAFATLVGSAFGLLLLGKRAAEQQREDALRQTETILGTLTTGVAIVEDGRLVRTNPALSAMLGRGMDEMQGSPVGVLFATVEDQRAWEREMEAALAHDGRHTGEHLLTRGDGSTRWAWTQAAPLDWQDGHRRVVVSVTDITDLRQLQEELATRAATDELTGLLNRRSFLERATIELSRAERTRQPVCVVVMDLDHLKRINDLHGHLVGDQALAAFAAASRHTLRDLDVLARLGGDEFAAVLPDATLAQAQAVMQRQVDLLEDRPLEVAGTAIALSASVGIAEYASPESLEALLARADRAMYAAKKSGRGAIARQDAL